MKTKSILSIIIPAVMIIISGCKSKEIKPKEFTSVPLYMAGQEIPGADHFSIMNELGSPTGRITTLIRQLFERT